LGGLLSRCGSLATGVFRVSRFGGVLVFYVLEVFLEECVWVESFGFCVDEEVGDSG